MKKLFLGFVLVAFATSISQATFAETYRCDPKDIDNATLHLNKRERLAQKGLALYSNPKELEELNLNFKSARKYEWASKSLFIFSFANLLLRGSSSVPGRGDPFLLEMASDMAPFLGMIGGAGLPIWGIAELSRTGKKRSFTRFDLSGGGFKIFDEAHQQLTIRRQEKTNAFEGLSGRIENSRTLGSTGVDALWALRTEYETHGELYKKELEYIKFQRDSLAEAKKSGICDHNEDISRSAVIERQQLIDAIDEMMDLRLMTERGQAEANYL